MVDAFFENVAFDDLLFISLGKGGDSDIGIIMYDVGGTKQTIPYSAKALTDGLCPKYGDQVSTILSLCMLDF